MSEIKIIDFNQELLPYKHNIIESERLKITAMSTYHGFMTRIMEYINSDESYSKPLTITDDVKSLCYVITFETRVKYPSSEKERIVTDAYVWEICKNKQLELNQNVIFNWEISKANTHFLNDKTEYDELKAAAYLFSFNDSLCDFYSAYPILTHKYFNENICIKAVVETDVTHTEPLAFYLFYANSNIYFSKFNPNFRNYLDEIIIKTASQRDLGLFLMTARAHSILKKATKIPYWVDQIKGVNAFCNRFDMFASSSDVSDLLIPDTLTRMVFNVTFITNGKVFFITEGQVPSDSTDYDYVESIGPLESKLQNRF